MSSVLRACASVGRIHLAQWIQATHGTRAAVTGIQKCWYSTNDGNQPHKPIKAVIFDMGGVLISAPGPLFKGTQVFKLGPSCGSLCWCSLNYSWIFLHNVNKFEAISRHLIHSKSYSLWHYILVNIPSLKWLQWNLAQSFAKLAQEMLGGGGGGNYVTLFFFFSHRYKNGNYYSTGRCNVNSGLLS